MTVASSAPAVPGPQGQNPVPKPLPMMTAYKAHGFDITDFPNAYHLFENEITLPLNTKMSMEDVEYVVTNFVDIVRGL